MVDTIKFSEMTDGGDIDNNKKTPGLSGGANVLFNNPWTFLPPGDTASRPTPSAEINYRLRFNTEEQLYEYYDAVLGAWTQLQESLFTQGPFLTYTADASIPDAQNLGALSDGLLKQTITLGVATLDIAVNGTDYYGPGFVIPPEDGGTGVNNGSNTLTLAGSLQTVGAFAAIFNFTAPTNVTFPTSGTLATTTGSTATLTGDSGTATASGGNINVVGTATGLTFTGATDTLTLGGTLNVAHGGTGLNALTAHNLIIGNGTSAATLLAPSAVTNAPLLSQGASADPAYGAFGLSLDGTLTTAAAHTLSGAFASTFTFTGITNVTFPTSGTLATTTGSVATLTGDSGTATASSGNINVVATGSGLLFTGSGATLTLAGTLNVGHGGTGVTSVTTSPTASAFAGWDANRNMSADNFLSSYTTTATAAGTTTLTVDSTYWQYFTGSTTQTVVLPVTSTLVLGHTFYVVNNSSGAVTVQSSGGNNVLTLATNTSALFTCILTSGTTAASWNFIYDFNAGGSGTVSAGTANQLAYYQSTGTTVVGLTSANNAGLLTNGSGVPAWVTVTGTGAPVLATSPTLITPTLGVALATSVQFSPSTGGIVGTQTNDDAGAGYVGQFVSSNVASGSAVAATSGIQVNITSISLTAGDWEVYGVGGTLPAATTTTSSLAFGTSETSATLVAISPNSTNVGFNGLTISANSPITVPIGICRKSFASTTTVYLVGVASFAISTMGLYGWIAARRVR
jgi:hypothetical protein